MAIDYSKNTKEELIAMLQARDADTTDLEVLALKIEHKTANMVEINRRSNDVLNIGALYADDKNLLSAALADKAGQLQTEITELKDLQTKLTTP